MLNIRSRMFFLYFFFFVRVLNFSVYVKLHLHSGPTQGTALGQSGGHSRGSVWHRPQLAFKQWSRFWPCCDCRPAWVYSDLFFFISGGIAEGLKQWKWGAFMESSSIAEVGS